jgi:hypothetical protein
MKPVDRKELVRQYQETPREAGVYRIRNTTTGKSLIGSSPDIPGMFNRVRFQLGAGSFPDRELQSDWNVQGAQAFAFETLDRLEPKDEPGYDAADDLRALKAMWLEKLTEAGEALYPQSRRGV